MDRKTLWEVAVACFIGAMLGVSTTVVLVAEYGLPQQMSLVIAAFVGALSGGICCHPAEVFYITVTIIRRLRRNFTSVYKTLVEAKPLATTKSVVVIICKRLRRSFVAVRRTLAESEPMTTTKDVLGGIVSGVKKHLRTISLYCFFSLIAVVFVVVSRLVMGQVIECSLGRPKVEFGFWFACLFASAIIILALYGVAATLVLYEKQLSCSHPSWQLPIIARLAKKVAGLLREFTTDDENDNEKFSFCTHLLGGLFFASIPLTTLLVFMLTLVFIVIDILTTLIFALASTERLSAMIGALIGTVVGSVCYFHGSQHISAIGIGGVAGVFMGLCIYALRRMLTYKSPASEPTLAQ